MGFYFRPVSIAALLQGYIPAPSRLHNPVLRRGPTHYDCPSGFGFPPEIAGDHLFQPREKISGRILRKTGSLAWGADPIRSFVPANETGQKRETMYKNNVELIGFLGKNAQVRTANTNDNEFTVLSIATQEYWKDEETGEWQKATEWHSVICNNALGKYAAGLTKGTHILVEGVLRSRTYTLQTGSGKEREEKQIRSWFVKANSIVKLDRPGKDVPSDSAPSEADPAETYESDF